MSIEDQYKLLLESYYGVKEMDEYDLKEYVLKKIDTLIKNYENEYTISDIQIIRDNVINNINLKTKLQSSLIVLNQINESMELILLIKNKLKNWR